MKARLPSANQNVHAAQVSRRALRRAEADERAAQELHDRAEERAGQDGLTAADVAFIGACRRGAARYEREAREHRRMALRVPYTPGLERQT
jgi:hypothetical protein